MIDMAGFVVSVWFSCIVVTFEPYVKIPDRVLPVIGHAVGACVVDVLEKLEFPNLFF